MRLMESAQSRRNHIAQVSTIHAPFRHSTLGANLLLRGVMTTICRCGPSVSYAVRIKPMSNLFAAPYVTERFIACSSKSTRRSRCNSSIMVEGMRALWVAVDVPTDKRYLSTCFGCSCLFVCLFFSIF